MKEEVECDQAMKGAKNAPTKGLSKFASMHCISELESSLMERDRCLKVRPPSGNTTPCKITGMTLHSRVR